MTNVANKHGVSISCCLLVICTWPIRCAHVNGSQSASSFNEALSGLRKHSGSDKAELIRVALQETHFGDIAAIRNVGDICPSSVGFIQNLKFCSILNNANASSKFSALLFDASYPLVYESRLAPTNNSIALVNSSACRTAWANYYCLRSVPVCIDAKLTIPCSKICTDIYGSCYQYSATAAEIACRTSPDVASSNANCFCGGANSDASNYCLGNCTSTNVCGATTVTHSITTTTPAPAHATAPTATTLAPTAATATVTSVLVKTTAKLITAKPRTTAKAVPQTTGTSNWFTVSISLALPMSISRFNNTAQQLFKVQMALASGLSESSANFVDIFFASAQRREASGGIDINVTIRLPSIEMAYNVYQYLTQQSVNQQLLAAGFPAVAVLSNPTTSFLSVYVPIQTTNQRTSTPLLSLGLPAQSPRSVHVVVSVALISLIQACRF